MNQNVYQTVHEMLHDRKYDKCLKQEKTMIVYEMSGSPIHKIVIFFIFETKVSVKKMKEIKDIIEKDEGYTHMIIVYKNNITSFAKQFISTNLNIHVQVFSENELSFNVTKHELVPKHEILTTGEKLAVLKKYKCESTKFPTMLSSDPVSRYYGLKPGTMVKITRPSPTSGEYTLYRLVT